MVGQRSSRSSQPVRLVGAGPPDATGKTAADDLRDLLILLIPAAIGFVLWRAWVCDDAFITFRHVENCLAGHGPVFNVGERVQGFTHPLWFGWLLAGAILFDVYAVAVLGGLLCTGLAVWMLGRVLSPHPHGPLLLVAGASVLLGSNAFVEFQTSGLETPLVNVLVVVLFGRWPLTREAAVRNLHVIPAAWVCSLLLITRADLVILCGPVLVFAAMQAWRGRPRQVAWFFGALSPALAWYAFATVYYGTPLPNTAYAKVAFPPAVALAHGTRYLLDYLAHEPFHALLMLAVVVWTGVRIVRSARRGAGSWIGLCLPAGIALHLIYVAAVGGDFMRGRFIAPALAAAVVLGSRMLGHAWPAQAQYPALRWLAARRPVPLACAALALAGFVSLYDLRPRVPSHEQVEIDGGIADEYAWYAGYWHRPRFRMPDSAPNELLASWVAGGQVLEKYSREHGPIAMAWGVMGILPYYAGPRVTVIDVLGLTDAFVARCPADPASRVGHIGHDIPMEYFLARGAVSSIPDAFERMVAGDPTLIEQARWLQQQAVWSDEQALGLWRDVQLVTRGPIFSWERLKAIPRYVFPVRRAFKPAA